MVNTLNIRDANSTHHQTQFQTLTLLLAHTAGLATIVIRLVLPLALGAVAATIASSWGCCWVEKEGRRNTMISISIPLTAAMFIPMRDETIN